MKNITEENIIKQVKQFTQIHPDFGFTITERNIERFAEGLVKKLTIPVVVESACDNYIDGINMQCASCDQPKYKH